ncbi:hypothetical protein SteCoe_22772 [Stentor coeruleus]|uniref:Ral GTPase-activating protein subunit alpha/beta N-terminal domain-containing protein n=1 Tax=Stentor coeruleus TaxID=5963 RepID=A0A1R2BLA4_9CILI|nr:hypothetical protein SteCoe_22772 [Stentor coeruleus]
MIDNPEARALVAESLVLGLSKQGNQSIRTEFHLSWAMECIGYSFNLAPRKYFNTIMLSITIYGNWLLNPTSAPGFLQMNLGFYQREILGHFSIAFSRQKDSLKQVEICTEILTIIGEFIRTQKLELETWMCLLKLQLKMTEEVLNNSRILDLLSYKALKTFLQVWLCSNTRDEYLWNTFKDMLYKNFDNLWVVACWTSVVLGLTKRVLNLLYGNIDKPLKIKFYRPKGSYETREVFTPEIDSEQVFYFWYRLLMVFLNENDYEFKPVDSRVLLVKGISKIIFQFLEICDAGNMNTELEVHANLNTSMSYRASLCLQDCFKAYLNYFMGRDRLPIPNITNILGLFRSWLYSITGSESFYTDLERSEAIKTHCHILSRAQGPCSIPDLEQFFIRVLYEMQSKSTKVCSEICMNFINLPKTNLKILEFILKPDGIPLMISDFLNDNLIEITTRRYCYKLLSIFANLSGTYNIKQLSSIITDAFFKHLGEEKDNEGLYLLIWTICSYLACLDNEEEILNALLRGLTGRLGSLDESIGNNFYVLIDCIGMLANLIDKSAVSIEVIKINVKNLISFIPRRGKNAEEIFCRIMLCIVDWVIAFPMVLCDQEIKNYLLKYLQMKKIFDKYTQFNEFLKDYLFNYIGTPECTGKWYKDYSKNKKSALFYSDTGVFSSEETEDYGIFNIKNHVGSFVWKVSQAEEDFQIKTTDITLNLSEKITTSQDYQEKTYTQIDFEDSLAEDFSSFLNIKHLYDKQQSLINDFKEKNIPTPSFCKVITNRKTPQIINQNQHKAKFKIIRKLASELGYLDIQTIKSIFPLNESSNPIFTNIDSETLQPLICFPIIYLPTPETNDITCMSSSVYYSEDFQDFLQSFGSRIFEDEDFPSFCKPHLEKFHSCLYKYHGFFHSVVVSPALCKKNLDFGIEKILEDYKVVVIWNERCNDRFSSKVPNIFHKVDKKTNYTVLLTPIGKKLINVNLEVPDEKQGPLLDNMIVSLKNLTKLLMFSIYNLECSFFTRYKTWKKRVDMIKECMSKDDGEKKDNIVDVLFMEA